MDLAGIKLWAMNAVVGVIDEGQCDCIRSKWIGVRFQEIYNGLPHLVYGGK